MQRKWSFRLRIVARLLAGAVVLAAAPAQAADTRALMVEHKCYICHADDYPKAGPAFADVAAAYGRDRQAVAHVAEVIRRGQHGSSPWRMPPHPELTRAEARAIALYILSVRAQASSPPPAERARPG